MWFETAGRILLIVGLGVALLGLVLLLLSRLPLANQIGNFPGDIRIEARGFTCIFPLASMLLVSIILTIVLNVIIRLINR